MTDIEREEACKQYGIRVRVSTELERANVLLEGVAEASRDPRAKDFRFLSAFFKDRDEEKKYIKGFHSREEGENYFKVEGIEESWYLIFDLGEPGVIYMC